jgi:hypothetical protein
LGRKEWHIISYSVWFKKMKGYARLSGDISTLFEMKKQTLAAFLDISGAYDNVLIDVLCGVILEKELRLV